MEKAASWARRRLSPAPAGQGQPFPWRRKERGSRHALLLRRLSQHCQQSKLGNPRFPRRPHARPRPVVRAPDLPLRPRSSRGAPLRASVTPVTPPEVSVELLLTRDSAPAGRPPPRGARSCGARSHRARKGPGVLLDPQACAPLSPSPGLSFSTLGMGNPPAPGIRAPLREEQGRVSLLP